MSPSAAHAELGLWHLAVLSGCHKPIPGATSCPSPLLIHLGDRGAAPGGSQEGKCGLRAIAPSLRHSQGLPGLAKSNLLAACRHFSRFMFATRGLIQRLERGGGDALGTGQSAGLGRGRSTGDGKQEGDGPRDLAIPDPAKLREDSYSDARMGKKTPTPKLFPVISTVGTPLRAQLSAASPCRAGSAGEPGVPPVDTRCRARGTPRAGRPALSRRDVQDKPFKTHSTSLTSGAQHSLAARHPWPLITHFCSH